MWGFFLFFYIFFGGMSCRVGFIIGNFKVYIFKIDYFRGKRVLCFGFYSSYYEGFVGDLFLFVFDILFRKRDFV